MLRWWMSPYLLVACVAVAASAADGGSEASSWMDALSQAHEEAKAALFQAFVPSGVIQARKADVGRNNGQPVPGIPAGIDIMQGAPDGIKLSNQGPTTGVYDEAMAFIHAIDWTEPFIICILVFHVVILALAVALIRMPTAQTVLFLALAATILAAPVLNDACRQHTQKLASQPYCDEGGAFISLMVSLPLLLLLSGVAVCWCVDATTAAARLGKLKAAVAARGERGSAADGSGTAKDESEDEGESEGENESEPGTSLDEGVAPLVLEGEGGGEGGKEGEEEEVSAGGPVEDASSENESPDGSGSVSLDGVQSLPAANECGD